MLIFFLTSTAFKVLPSIFFTVVSRASLKKRHHSLRTVFVYKTWIGIILKLIFKGCIVMR